MKGRLAFASIVVAVIVTAIGIVALQTSAGVQRAGAQTVVADPAKLDNIFGAQFQPAASAAAGSSPLLPSGAAAISEQQAIASAIGANSPATGIAAVGGRLLPDVEAQAEYGTITLTRYGTRTATGQIIPLIHDRPVWLITLSGSGLAVGAEGPDADSAPPHHELDVIIDASSGQFLRAFSYR